MRAKKMSVFSLAALSALSVCLLSSGVLHAAEAGQKTEAAAAGKKAELGPTWAFQPIQKPQPPAVKQKQWARTPIDTFILAEIEASGLTPSKDTDRAIFIRRATLDAWGLLPTPEEVDAFVKDKSPDAYEKLVDRLLSSHHFGERQARRWLDLARYADTTGFQNDNVRANNWRYRDYVIKSFNDNKPYYQFVLEQIAGDELFPKSQEAKIATGFLAGYPDNHNSRDLIARQYEISVDITNTVGEVFLGTTVGCAQCHNHKSDKISQKEYFQLISFFANTVFDPNVPLAKGTETAWDTQFIEAQKKYREATKDIRDKQKAVLDKIWAKGIKYHKERYLTDSREAIFKPKEQWTPLDRWVNFRYGYVVSENNSAASYLQSIATETGFPDYDPSSIPLWEEYKALRDELRKFDHLRPTRGSGNITAATELGSDAPPTFIRFAGIHERPTDEVQPGLPELWGGDKLGEIKPTATSSGRRSALAQWIIGSNNPLTARVYVNRVWGQYFDKPLVVTPDNFGRSGGRPTHPELLDYLASKFKDNWDIKALHREILLSSVYRQSSEERPEVVKADQNNVLLAVYPRKRLDAEEIRDSLLYASGQLVDEVGGPAVFPPLIELPRGDGKNASLDAETAGGVALAAAQGRQDARWPVSTDRRDWNRRSIYTFVRRSLPYPLIQVFDPSDPSLAYHKRDVTTTPLQALTLFNSEVAINWSQALTGRLINEAGTNPDAVVDRLYQILFSRRPNSTELAVLKDFLNQEEKVVQQQLASGVKVDLATPTGVNKPLGNLSTARQAALVDLVHTVVNSNEFVYRF
jgi:hypothetical protein